MSRSEAVAQGRFAGRVAVVTGAGAGIGRAIALRFSKEGAIVAGLDMDAQALGELAAIEVGITAAITTLTVDLTDTPATVEAIRAIERELGPIEILVNNVGRSARENATEFYLSDPQTWDEVLDISLRAAMMCSRYIIPGMRERRRGRIVNITSDAALVGDVGVADYVTAKAALVGFTRSIAREMAPFGVTVNAVGPGPTKTAGPRSMPKAILDRVLEGIPLGELCDPDDVANAVAFLASDEARMITGQLLVVDGGRTFH